MSHSTDEASPTADTTGNRERVIVGALIIAALAFRLWILPRYQVISVDGTGFAEAARLLAHGDSSLLARYGFYPVLVAMVHLIIPNVEQAGRLVSVAMGALLVAPVYALGVTFFERRVAICAALLIIGWPELVHWSCEVMAQSTFMTLTFTAILLVWRGYSRQSGRTMLLAGVVLGLAYATRTEALLLLVALLAAPVAASFWHPEHHRRLSAQLLVPYVTGFLFILLPNILLVHEATGKWQMAVRTSGALRDGLSYYLELADHEMPPELDHVTYWSIIRHYPGYILYSVAKNSMDSLRLMLPTPLWFLAAMGLLTGGWNREAIIRRLYLASSFAPYLVIIVFFYVGPEYYQPYLPVLFLWVGQGLARCDRFLVATTAHLRCRRVLTVVPLTLLVAAGWTSWHLYHRMLPDKVAPHQRNSLDGRLVQKELGLMVDRFLPPGKIMTRWARTAFYADREWAIIPATGTPEDLLRTARQQQVRFLIVDAMAVINCPLIAPLFEPADVLSLMERPLEPQVKYVAEFKVRPYPGMLLFMLYRDQRRVNVAIYEIEPEGQ